MNQGREIEYLGDSRRIYAVDYGSYPDGMPLVAQTSGPAWAEQYVPVERVTIRPKSLDTLVTGLFWIDALIERGNKPPELMLPCLPGARQDRLNPNGDYLFTAKSIAKMINALKLPRVICVDPHSEVMPGLIDRCFSIPASKCIEKIVGRHYDAVVSPDAGAEKRASAVAKRFNAPLIHAWKTRDVQTGAISGFGIEPYSLPGRTTSENPDGERAKVLVVDDICDGGGTFIGLEEQIDTVLNADADLYVTHGIFSQGTEKLHESYMRIFCTDSLIADREGVTVLPIREDLLRQGTL